MAGPGLGHTAGRIPLLALPGQLMILLIHAWAWTGTTSSAGYRVRTPQVPRPTGCAVRAGGRKLRSGSGQCEAGRGLSALP
jgi:hypothetical protein